MTTTACDDQLIAAPEDQATACPDWHARLHKERDDLSEKIDKLTNFISRMKISEIGVKPAYYLFQQRDAMIEYRRILDCRIHLAATQG